MGRHGKGRKLKKALSKAAPTINSSGEDQIDAKAKKDGTLEEANAAVVENTKDATDKKADVGCEVSEEFKVRSGNNNDPVMVKGNVAEHEGIF